MALERRTINWRQPEGASIPSMKPIQIVTMRCHNCGRDTCAPAETIIDAAVDHWRERYQTVLGEMNALIARCHKLHGYNPCERFFMEEMIKIRDEIDRKYQA